MCVYTCEVDPAWRIPNTFVNTSLLNPWPLAYLKALERVLVEGEGSEQLGRRNWQEFNTDKTEEMRQGERKHLEHLAGVISGSLPEVTHY